MSLRFCAGQSGTAVEQVGTMRHVRSLTLSECRILQCDWPMIKEGRVTDHSDIPPTHTIKPMDPPPPSARPTVAMLQGDIDSGRTGDKNPMFDPSGAPLGTDDEAAGTPPTPFRVAVACYYETVERWIGGDWKPDAAHHRGDGIPAGFIGFIVAVGVVLIVGIWMVGSPSPGA
jgi:hypothetical protein